MTRLEYLSQFSNAVLTPELNTCEIAMPGQANHNNSDLKMDDIAFRKNWCKQQIELIGEFGAVLGGGV